MEQVFANLWFSGDDAFAGNSGQWLEVRFEVKKAFLTHSCTHALGLSGLLTGIKAGDQVIMPSYTFPSSANVFILRGAKIVFVDIRPDAMNIDENLIEEAITSQTRAIVPTHYAGMACEMAEIMDLANRYSLHVFEDAAQGVMSKYRDKFLGTIGHLGCYSFHETKNYQCGEGGPLLINDAGFIESA